MAVTLSACGGGNHPRISSDPAVRQAQAAVDARSPPLRAYRGPSGGPRAQRSGPVVFVAADVTDEGIAAVARGVQQAASAMGWSLQIVDGEADVQTESQAIRSALRERPGG
ncbi:MAG: hypothetical protein JO325_20355, partial [Solirubrobacterales bacterium]|nr:hypothetical protein [Solirubrobacterales bacterium]